MVLSACRFTPAVVAAPYAREPAFEHDLVMQEESVMNGCDQGRLSAQEERNKVIIFSLTCALTGASWCLLVTAQVKLDPDRFFKNF